MSKEFRGLTIELNGDTTKLQSALRAADKQIVNAAKSLREVERGLKLNPGNTELVTQKQRLLANQIANNEKKLKSLRAAEKQIGRENMSTEQWDKLQRAIAETEGYVNSYKGRLDEALTAERKLAKASEAFGKAGSALQKAGGGMQAAGKSITRGVTLPIVATGAAAVKAAVDIDDALTSVKKTVDGTDEQYQQH